MFEQNFINEVYICSTGKYNQSRNDEKGCISWNYQE